MSFQKLVKKFELLSNSRFVTPIKVLCDDDGDITIPLTTIAEYIMYSMMLPKHHNERYF